MLVGLGMCFLKEFHITNKIVNKVMVFRVVTSKKNAGLAGVFGFKLKNVNQDFFLRDSDKPMPKSPMPNMDSTFGSGMVGMSPPPQFSRQGSVVVPA